MYVFSRFCWQVASDCFALLVVVEPQYNVVRTRMRATTTSSSIKEKAPRPAPDGLTLNRIGSTAGSNAVASSRLKVACWLVAQHPTCNLRPATCNHRGRLSFMPHLYLTPHAVTMN